MSTFVTMKTNVGTTIQDTSSAMASVIGIFLNRRYFQILRQINWKYINEDYTIAMVAGTQDYALPADFKKELYVVDVTNNREISKVSLDNLARYNPSSLSTEGSVSKYTIFNSDDGSKYIRFHYIPSAVATMNVPYIVKATALSADGDEPVLDFSDLMEIGATADALRYKRKYSQAKDIEVQYRLALDDYIWDEYNQPAKIYQFKPRTFNRDNLV